MGRPPEKLSDRWALKPGLTAVEGPGAISIDGAAHQVVNVDSLDQSTASATSGGIDRGEATLSDVLNSTAVPTGRTFVHSAPQAQGADSAPAEANFEFKRRFNLFARFKESRKGAGFLFLRVLCLVAFTSYYENHIPTQL